MLALLSGDSGTVPESYRLENHFYLVAAAASHPFMTPVPALLASLWVTFMFSDVINLCLSCRQLVKSNLSETQG